MCLCVFVLLQTEQLKEMKQEFIKQEEQLREVKKNSTTLERKLEYERYVKSLLLPVSLSGCPWGFPSLLSNCDTMAKQLLKFLIFASQMIHYYDSYWFFILIFTIIR